MNNNTTTTAISPSVADSICVSIRSKFDSGMRITLENEAKAHRITQKELRDILTEKYGNSIQFRKGRNGGIFFTG